MRIVYLITRKSPIQTPLLCKREPHPDTQICRHVLLVDFPLFTIELVESQVGLMNQSLELSIFHFISKFNPKKKKIVCWIGANELKKSSSENLSLHYILYKLIITNSDDQENVVQYSYRIDDWWIVKNKNKSNFFYVIDWMNFEFDDHFDELVCEKNNHREYGTIFFLTHRWTDWCH